MTCGCAQLCLFLSAFVGSPLEQARGAHYDGVRIQVEQARGARSSALARLLSLRSPVLALHRCVYCIAIDEQQFNLLHRCQTELRPRCTVPNAEHDSDCGARHVEELDRRLPSRVRDF